MDDVITETKVLDPLTICGVSAALTAAHTTGLLDWVLGDSHTAAECAAHLGLDERMVGKILDVLAASGYILKHGNRYGVPADAPASLKLTGTWLTTALEHFGHTLRALRTGELLNWMEQREATYRNVVGELGRTYDGIAAFLAKQVRGQPERILDVGCGSGVWSLAIARNYPGARVSGLDFPKVLETFLDRAQKLHLGERIDLLPGDMFDIELAPEQFDLIVIANVLRLEPPLRAEQLVARVVPALRPGGQLIVVDALAIGTPAKDLARAAYALHLALRTQEGQVHTPIQIRQWMQRTGLMNLEEIDCGVQITAIGVLVGTKPS